MTTTTPETKIVIVAGQRFSVPAATENEAIRQQLVTMGFADVASAKIETGKETVEGVEYETIEFVKKAGTKGLDGAGLATLLAQVPGTRASTIRGGSLVWRLLQGDLTFAEALADDRLDQALQEIGFDATIGGPLCRSLDALGAIAADIATW